MMLRLALAALLSGCCAQDIASRHAAASLAVNEAHRDDESLGVRAREIAGDNADAWRAQLEILEGEPVE